MWECELSMDDTAVLIASVLTTGTYFSAAGEDEPEIRELAGFLYRRIDWPWRPQADLWCAWDGRPGRASQR